MGDIHAEYVDIHCIMQENSEHLGEKNYLVSLDQQKCLTFSEINYYCNKVANFLKNKGIKKDDKICIIGKNSIETMIIFFGVLKYGAIISPLNVDESKENIYSIINRLSPRFIIYDEKINFDHANTSHSWIPFSNFDREEQREGDFFSLIRDYDSLFKTPIAGRNDIAEIFFTSGTTDIPKGVVASRKSLFYMTEAMRDKLGITGEDRILEYRAYSWASAQAVSILTSMNSGATLFLGQKFSRSKFPHWLKENDITIAVGVPTVFNILISDPIKLHGKDLPALKFITSSSAPLSPEICHAFEKLYGISINQIQGMSEAGGVFGNPPDKRKPGSVGTSFKHMEICILNEHGLECHTGEEGEIILKGKALGIGYLNEQGAIDRYPDQGLPTGDLGYMDSDGYVFLTGRKKEIIIRGGVNISPMEITGRLMEHPCVKEAATIGIPDKIYGEEIASFIVPRPGCKIESQNIINHCKATLPDFKIPKEIHFLEDIPKTERGKVTKQDLLNIINLKRSN